MLNLDNIPEFAKAASDSLTLELEQRFQLDEIVQRDLNSWVAYNYTTTDEDTQRMLAQAVMYKDLHYNVLVEGPSGTGKELVASILSWRGKGPNFKSINMAGLTDSLFESQLFGYAPGAFTGALSKGSKGFLQSVGQGVAFMDEIGELPLSQQAKILRVIQSNEVMPVGAVDPVRVGCRFVFATNRSLLDMVRKGTFREDLYFRISQLVLRTKALSARPADIMLIAKAIIQRRRWTPLAADEYIAPEQVELGNVRAIENILIQRQFGGLQLKRL